MREELQDAAYPVWKIFFIYLLLGSPLGSMLYLLFMLLAELHEIWVYGKSWDLFLDVVGFILFFGSVLGFFPAVLTGAFISLAKMQRRSWHYFLIATVGFVTSFFMVLWMLGASLRELGREPVFLLISFIGTLSALILAYFLLPRKAPS